VVLGAYYSGSSAPAAASDIVSITLPQRPTHIASTGRAVQVEMSTPELNSSIT